MERAGELVMIFIAVVVVTAEVRLCWAGIFCVVLRVITAVPSKRRPV